MILGWAHYNPKPNITLHLRSAAAAASESYIRRCSAKTITVKTRTDKRQLSGKVNSSSSSPESGPHRPDPKGDETYGDLKLTAEPDGIKPEIDPAVDYVARNCRWTSLQRFQGKGVILETVELSVVEEGQIYRSDAGISRNRRSGESGPRLKNGAVRLSGDGELLLRLDPRLDRRFREKKVSIAVEAKEDRTGEGGKTRCTSVRPSRERGEAPPLQSRRKSLR